MDNGGFGTASTPTSNLSQVLVLGKKLTHKNAF